VRRPHPRFDTTRNAWVTRAGGTLAVLAKGPKTAATEEAALAAFYAHMARLGQPVAEAPTPSIAIGELCDRFGDWMSREVGAGRMKTATLAYYRHHLQRFIDQVGGRRAALAIPAYDVEMFKTGWHSVQAIQRLYNWGVKLSLISHNPFATIQKPAAGRRHRVLSVAEGVQLLRASAADFRLFLLAMQHTLARPQEIRALQWKHLREDPTPTFVLTEFKAKNRMKDKQALRRIQLDGRMLRMLDRLKNRQPHGPNDFVFRNKKGVPWTGQAIRLRMTRLRKKVGLTSDESGESVVCYTLRHTSATRATANGVQDKTLAELMGHTNTRTTERYQHLQDHHLAEAIRRANRRTAQ
jgi:integrase